MDYTHESPFYLARSEICVNDKGECIGNGVFSSHDYEEGTLIATVRRPFVGALDAQRLGDTCANCYLWTEGSHMGSRLYVPKEAKVSACMGCKRFKYCSKRCQKQAWNRIHRYECPLVKDLVSKDIPKAVQATMEILIRRKIGEIPNMQWNMLCSLDSHLEDFKRGGSYDDIQLMARGAHRFSRTVVNYHIDFVEEMYARVLSNSLTIVTPTFDPLGIFIDDRLSTLNHSCDPNAYIVMDGPAVSLRTLKPIRKDEEIYISYIDNTNPYARRQSELKSRWFFTCKCTKCQKGATLSEDQWAFQPQNLSENWKNTGDLLIDFAKDPANYVGDSKDEKKVAAIQGQVYKMYERAQQMSDPALAIHTIEKGMQVCYQSGLWPVYRQPYAALRDDLIVNMLAVGKFELAWYQCAKRYKHIHPKLHQQKFHPVRVVQLWQMTMLAVFLSGEEPLAEDFHIDLLAFLLIKDVYELCKKSHGENSTFFRSVEQTLKQGLDTMKVQNIPQRDIDVQWRKLEEMGDWVQ